MLFQPRKVVSAKNDFSVFYRLPQFLFSPRCGVSVSLRLCVVPLVLVAACCSAPSAGAQESPVAGQNQNTGTATAQEREVVVVAQRGLQISFNIGSDDGVRVGTEFEVRRGGAALMRVRVFQLSATQSTAQILEQSPDAANLAVGETVRVATSAASNTTPLSPVSPATITPPSTTAPSTTAPVAASDSNGDANTLGMGAQAQMAMQRTPKSGDYLAALAGLALVLSASSSPSKTPEQAFLADQQFSAISPFPGGGYSVLPSGALRPGGAFAVNIPMAYAPNRLSGVLSFDVAQNRSNQSITNANGRNGTANIGVGFGVAGRPVWLSRQLLSNESFQTGGDAVNNVLVQLAPETDSVPALAVGIQDISNARERSPFLVATKQLRASRPLFATLGVGRGRFSGSTLFGGISYSPTNRVSLSTEYDGLQLNIGAGFAVTRRFSLLASYNDLAEQDNRPAGALLGRRYQIGANYGF